MAGPKHQSAGKQAMFREAKAKQAAGKPHHTRLTNIPKPKKQDKAPSLEGEYAHVKPEKKSKGKKKPGKGNVPNPY